MLDTFSDEQSSQWLMVSEAFLRFFVETIGHFGQYVRTQQDGYKVFLVGAIILPNYRILNYSISNHVYMGILYLIFNCHKLK